jgi:hypothetical protein
LSLKVRGALLDLRSELARGERVVRVEQLPQIATSLDWLLHSRRTAGYWGVEDVAVTSLACLAIARWQPAEARTTLAASAQWLSAQAVDGAWETYWDTAVATQALLAADQQGTETVQAAVAYMRSLDLEDEQTWAGGVHHAAQILKALADAQAPAEVIDEWTRCVRKHLKTEAGVYVCSQAIYAMIASGTASPADLTTEIAYVKQYVTSSGRPSEGGLRDYAPAIQALSVTPENKELVLEKGGAILSAYTDGRAWYKEPRQTAWALLALHSANSVTQIVTDRATFNRAFAVAAVDITKGQRRRRVTVAALTALLALQIDGIAALVVFWNNTT